MNPYELVETSVGCKIISSIFSIFLVLLCSDISTPIVSRTVNRTLSQDNATLVTVSKRPNDNVENIMDIYSKIDKISRLRLVPSGIIATRTVRWPRKWPNRALIHWVYPSGPSTLMRIRSISQSRYSISVKVNRVDCRMPRLNHSGFKIKTRFSFRSYKIFCS